jgi:HpcH/HpaI aldolase/citrate lyase family
VRRVIAPVLARSYLYVPADQPDRLAGAPGRGADALIADLEDAVAPHTKATARKVVRDWLAGQAGTSVPVWLRVNADQADADIAEAVPGNLAGVVVPKAEPGLLAEIDDLLTIRERVLALPDGTIGVLPLIETAAGLLSAAAVAASTSPPNSGCGQMRLPPRWPRCGFRWWSPRRQRESLRRSRRCPVTSVTWPRSVTRRGPCWGSASGRARPSTQRNCR